ncbi:hypothetical protein [Mariniluteicoccus flavus]
MRHVAVGLAAALLLASACTPKDEGGTRDPSITYGNPTPTETAGTPTPTARATPSTEELVRQTQAVYQVAFDEYERLTRAGGADEASPRLKQVMQGTYLDLTTKALREQKATGYRIEGRAATTKSRSAAGTASQGSDPRLTLEVCEDRRGATLIERNGQRAESGFVAGHVFAAQAADGRIKLTSVRTRPAEQCVW